MREPDRIIRLKTVLSRTGLSRSTIYRKIAEGTFPAQLKISANGTGGMNPTSTAGSPIPSHGVRNVSSMRSDSPLTGTLSNNQAAWTVLAVNEDIFLRDHSERPHEEMHAVVDARLNALTHPLRACLKHCKSGARPVRRAYVSED